MNNKQYSCSRQIVINSYIVICSFIMAAVIILITII